MRSAMALPLLLLAACSAPPAPVQPRVVNLYAPAWVADATAGRDASAQAGSLLATGRAALAPDRAAVARAAESDARKQLQPGVEAAVGRLHSVFRARHEAELLPAQLDALAARDPAARELIAKVLAGARLRGQWSDDQALYAWLELDTRAVLLPAFEADLGARLQPLARELTPADHAAFAEALLALVAERGGR
jgi:hypothetical protein